MLGFFIFNAYGLKDLLAIFIAIFIEDSCIEYIYIYIYIYIVV